MLIYAANPGEWNNDISFEFLNAGDSNPSVREPNSALLTVFYDGTQVEQFYVSRDKNAISSTGRSLYIETVLEASEFIRALDNDTLETDSGDLDLRMPLDVVQRLSLAGGSNGNAVTASHKVSAAKMLRPTDRLPIRFLSDGGHGELALKKELIATAEVRDDAIAILTFPEDVVRSSDYIQSMINYKRSTLASGSSYAGIFGPHILAIDPDNDREVYLSGSGQIAGLWSRQWDQDLPWRPAANERGIITASGLLRTFTSAELDRLAEENINPIRWDPDLGIRIHGEYALYSRPGPFGRLHNRALLNFIKGPLRTQLDSFLFNLNVLDDSIGTQVQVKQVIDTFMETVRANLGIYRYETVVDDRNNTPGDIANRTLNVWLRIWPTETIEYIPISIGVTSDLSVNFELAETLV